MVDLENVAARNQCLGHRVDALVEVWRLGWLVSRLVPADPVSNFVVYYQQYSSTSTKAGIYLLAGSMELLGANWDTTLYHQKHCLTGAINAIRGSSILPSSPTPSPRLSKRSRGSMALILPDIRTCLVLSDSRPVFSRKSSCLCRNHSNEENPDFILDYSYTTNYPTCSPPKGDRNG
ncbi:predicted protein [Histoplasma capsulatum var. duboisii H88]|uniref:Predicted protein n=1 Tax=Ajellomyces capsulatus (strain H88) TaxID=544711 RepID=F0UP95_AJEC8|nr:predicted protein [Histoplasma capsulatum var. duboisii H88]